MRENHVDYKYIKMLHHIGVNGVKKSNRTGIDTISMFGYQERFDLKEGFPLLTSKKMAWKTILSELLWFISGSDNINDLKAIYAKNTIWDANYKDWNEKNGLIMDGEMGRIYGVQWRRFGVLEIDQLRGIINTLKNNPDDRRIIVTAWNPEDVNDAALPPCHCFFQFWTKEVDGKRYLSCQIYQRSCDSFLGVPFNWASYAALVHIIAHCTDMIPDELIWVGGDVHIYENHIEQCKEQQTREIHEMPQLKINTTNKDIDSFTMNNFELVGYKHSGVLKGEMAV